MSPGEPPKSPRLLEFTVDLPTDPDTVWRLLTDPAGDRAQAAVVAGHGS